MEQNCSIALILVMDGLEIAPIILTRDYGGLEYSGSRKGGREGVKWGKSRILTPELVVVAAALRLPAAVTGLTDVALVVNAFTVQQALQERSTDALRRNVWSTSQL